MPPVLPVLPGAEVRLRSIDMLFAKMYKTPAVYSTHDASAFFTVTLAFTGTGRCPYRRETRDAFRGSE